MFIPANCWSAVGWGKKLTALAESGLNRRAAEAVPTACTGGPGAPLRQPSEATASAGTFHFCNEGPYSCGLFNSSGSLAMPAATFLASSLVMRLAAVRLPGFNSK